MKTQRASDVELQVMKVIWKRWEKREKCSSKEILLEFNLERKKEVKYQTVCTFLTRLERKGYIVSTKEGEYTYYEPTVSRDEWVYNAIAECCYIAGLPSENIMEALKAELTK